MHTYKPSHIRLGGFGGVGVCIGVPVKQGQTQDTSRGHSKKGRQMFTYCPQRSPNPVPTPDT